MRARGLTAFVRSDVAPWWRRQREVGVRLATAERLRDLLALAPEDDPTSARLADIEAWRRR